MKTNFLKNLNFTEPNTPDYFQDGFYVKKEFQTMDDMLCEVIVLKQNNFQWMNWNKTINKEVFELYSHYSLAKGHCICAGMGFLLRENWLLTKKEVTKITVVEINQNLINYHKIFNPEIIKKIEVINDDIYNFKGKCNTLLLDHFEGGIDFEPYFLSYAKKICSNVSHDLAWMWPMELILTWHYRDYLGLSLVDIYENIKKYFNLKTFPNLNEKKLFDFCHKYHIGNFSPCDFTKKV